MGKVIVDLSVSVDGFVAGAGDGMRSPLGRGGEALFAWMGAGPPPEPGVDERLAVPTASKVVIDEWVTGTGAMVIGRRTFDIARGWAGGHPIDAPIFVPTHVPPTEGEWSPQVTFVPEGVERALDLAQEVAGDKTVSVAAGSVVQQTLALGRLDEVNLSVTPVLLGAGVRLFDHLGGPVALEQVRVIESDGVTHLRYRVVK
jgi:dihydrofolate reductase